MPALIFSLLFLAALFGVSGLEANESGDARSIYEANAGSNRFYVRATGDIEYENSFIIPKNTPAHEVFWDCKGNALRVGYSWGALMRPGWETMVAAVETPVAAGQTGSFEMKGMTWGYGQEPMPGQPADSTFNRPRSFEGFGGELRLTSHEVENFDRRVQGVAEGEVKAKSSDLTVQLYLEFDLNKSCK